MQKYINIVLKVILSLLFVMPILGTLGVFPAPTADMYNDPKAFVFIKTLSEVSTYINYIMAIVFALSLVLVWTKRTALAMLLILPITVNIIAFHLFLDGGLFTAGAVMGNIFFLLNLYFIWQERANYSQLLARAN
jgi:NADH:ubiquinone oxidoreductase subunit K